MLALARKVNESIILNDNIEVTVLEVKGDQVKIGINAPKDVPIYRKELFVQIQEADAVEAAVKKVLKDGYRTVDIMDEGKTQVGTIEMGDLICERI